MSFKRKNSNSFSEVYRSEEAISRTQAYNNIDEAFVTMHTLYMIATHITGRSFKVEIENITIGRVAGSIF